MWSDFLSFFVSLELMKTKKGGGVEQWMPLLFKYIVTVCHHLSSNLFVKNARYLTLTIVDKSYNQKGWAVFLEYFKLSEGVSCCIKITLTAPTLLMMTSRTSSHPSRESTSNKASMAFWMLSKLKLRGFALHTENTLVVNFKFSHF